MGDGINWPVIEGCDEYTLTVDTCRPWSIDSLLTSVKISMTTPWYFSESNWPRRKINGRELRLTELSKQQLDRGSR